MKRILRPYPAGWRERYGEEMESILEEGAMGAFEMVDLFLGALDAHLHRRGLGNRSVRSVSRAPGSVWGPTPFVEIACRLPPEPRPPDRQRSP
jgi:hypothetical protein